MANIEVKQDFVTFYSPGTFFAETTSRPVDSWNVTKAFQMAGAITERYDAQPYGFRFLTRGRSAGDLDSRILAQSGMYYLRGRIETLEEVESRGSERDNILISNMRGNCLDRVIRGVSRWAWCQSWEDGDTVLCMTAAAWPPEE